MANTGYTYEDWVDVLEAHGLRPRKQGRGVKAMCPAHEDRNPSLSVQDKPDGVAVKCFAGCEFTAIRDALGLAAVTAQPVRKRAPKPPPEPPKPQPLPVGPSITQYRYTRGGGEPVMVVVRRDRRDGKTFSQWTPAGDGLWIHVGLPDNRPLYRLDDLPPEGPVLVVEGEKCVEAVRQAWPEREVVCWPGGTDSWSRADWTPLAGRHVQLLSDADKAGRKAMTDLAAHLDGLGCSVELGLSDGDDGADVADWIAEDAAAASERVAALLRPASPVRQDVDAWQSPAGEPPPRGATLERDMDGLLAAFEFFHLELRSNARTGAPEIRRRDFGSDEAAKFCAKLGLSTQPDGWAVMGDRAAAHFRNLLEQTFNAPGGARYRLGDDLFARALNAALASRDVDPVKDWLESLPEWDGTERIPTLFANALGAEDTPLNKAAARVLLVGAVARTFEPGVKHEDVPVLIGEQGAGKSTLAKELLPPGRDTWFAELADLAEKRQVILEAIGDAVIVEAAEMRGVHAVAQLKNFISSRSDRYRRPYAHTSDNQLRRWVAIGTANDAGMGALPDDPTGNRRWIAVAVKPQGNSRQEQSAHVRKYLDANRTQLWAEALAKYNKGVPHFIQADEEGAQDMVNLQYTRANQPLDTIAERLTAAHAGKTAVTLLELLLESGLAKDEADAADRMKGVGAQLAGYLRKLQWTSDQKTIGGKRGMYWFPPVPVGTAPAALGLAQCMHCPRSGSFMLSPRGWCPVCEAEDKFPGGGPPAGTGDAGAAAPDPETQAPLAFALDGAIARLEAEHTQYEYPYRRPDGGAALTPEFPKHPMVKGGRRGTWQALQALRGLRAVKPDEILTAGYLAGVSGGAETVVTQIAVAAAAADPRHLVNVDWRVGARVWCNRVDQAVAKTAELVTETRTSTLRGAIDTFLLERKGLA